MKNIRVFFLSENFHFLVVNFSIYLNRRVFVMHTYPNNLTKYVNRGTLLSIDCLKLLAEWQTVQTLVGRHVEIWDLHCLLSVSV